MGVPPNPLTQRSQLMVVRWSETTRNYVGPPEHSYPVVLWTIKISSPNHKRNMPQRYKQLSQLAGDNTTNTVPSPTLLTEKTRV